MSQESQKAGPSGPTSYEFAMDVICFSQLSDLVRQERAMAIIRPLTEKVQEVTAEPSPLDL